MVLWGRLLFFGNVCAIDSPVRGCFVVECRRSNALVYFWGSFGNFGTVGIRGVHQFVWCRSVVSTRRRLTGRRASHFPTTWTTSVLFRVVAYGTREVRSEAGLTFVMVTYFFRGFGGELAFLGLMVRLFVDTCGYFQEGGHSLTTVRSDFWRYYFSKTVFPDGYSSFSGQGLRIHFLGGYSISYFRHGPLARGKVLVVRFGDKILVGISNQVFFKHFGDFGLLRPLLGDFNYPLSNFLTYFF